MFILVDQPAEDLPAPYPRGCQAGDRHRQRQAGITVTGKLLGRRAGLMRSPGIGRWSPETAAAPIGDPLTAR